MNDNTHFDQDDLALFAMQLLSEQEELQLQAQLERSPDLRRELAEVQGDLAIYATTVEMHAPPAIARERLLTQIGRERKVRSIDRTDTRADNGTDLPAYDPLDSRSVDPSVQRSPGYRVTATPATVRPRTAFAKTS